MSDRSLSEQEEFFLALSDGTRLRLLSLMRNGEVSVGFLSEQLNTSQPKISRHLAYLRSAGLVETRRDGKWIYYHIARPVNRFASRSLDDALAWAGSITGDAREPASIESHENAADAPSEGSEWRIEEETYSNNIEVYLL